MMFSSYLSALIAFLLAPSVWPQTTPAANFYTAPEYKPVDGLLNTTIEVDWFWSFNRSRYAPAHNGGPVGPTIRLSPGDTFIVTLINKLEPETAYASALKAYTEDPFSNRVNVTIIENRLDTNGILHQSEYGYWGHNYQNLHFHGARADANVEGIGYSLHGGESRTCVYQLSEDQPSGFAWYHNRFHGGVRRLLG